MGTSVSPCSEPYERDVTHGGDGRAAEQEEPDDQWLTLVHLLSST